MPGFSGQYLGNRQYAGLARSPTSILDDNATKIHGRHEFQFGFHFRVRPAEYPSGPAAAAGQPQLRQPWARRCTIPPLPAPTPAPLPYTGHNLAKYVPGDHELLQFSSCAATSTRAGGSTHRTSRTTTRSLPRLTLNLGVRWEYWPAYSEKNNFFTGFNFDQRAIVTGNPLDEMYRLEHDASPAIVYRYEQLGAKFITYKDAGLPQTFMDDNYRRLRPAARFRVSAGPGQPRRSSCAAVTASSYFPLPPARVGRDHARRTRRSRPASAPARTTLRCPPTASETI